MKFLITIDTEGDNQWEHGADITVENLKYIPRFQELCNKYSIKPTYLVTSEVCTDEYCREMFGDYLNRGELEIGAHLHSWTTPPFMERAGFKFNDTNHVFANELSSGLLTEKIINLTNQIQNAFGKKPTSFRSGRYGFNQAVAETLVENSYLVDSSVTPYTTWKSKKGLPGGEGGPDFRKNNAYPYNYTFPNGSLLEIPITILPTQFPLNRSARLADFYFGRVDHSVLLRILRKLFFRHQPLWLRPFSQTTIKQLDEIVREGERIQLPFLVMMFHSSELMPGCSIYRKDKNSIEALYDLFELFFTTLKNRSIHSISLTDAAISFKQ